MALQQKNNGEEGKVVSFQAESIKKLSNADIGKEAMKFLAAKEPTVASYNLEIEILRRIKTNDLPKRLFLTLNDMKWRTPLEKSIIMEIEKYSQSNVNFNLYVELLKEEFEKNKPQPENDINKEKDNELSGDTDEARALIDRRVQETILAYTGTGSDPMQYPAGNDLDVIDGSRIGQIMIDLGYNE